MIYKFDQLTERMLYDESPLFGTDGDGFHVGQLKLLFTEVMFISKFLDKSPKKVVYVGAGSDGYHNTYLADMFPQIQFDLWDAGTFSVEDRPNIKIFKRYFKNEDAYNYAGEKAILFMSDIRNLAIANNREDLEAYDKIIEGDMIKQMKWTQIIKPMASYLKFKLPIKPQFFDYFKGTIYLQPFGPYSSESRILVTKYDAMVTYDSYEFDEKLVYFNSFMRNKEDSYKKWKKIMEKHDIINCWNTAYAFNILKYYLKKNNRKYDHEAIGGLYMDIMVFYRKRFEKKAVQLFNIKSN